MSFGKALKKTGLLLVYIHGPRNQETQAWTLGHHGHTLKDACWEDEEEDDEDDKDDEEDDDDDDVFFKQKTAYEMAT